MYSLTATIASVLVGQRFTGHSSSLKRPKKDSAGALSQHCPLRLMLQLESKDGVMATKTRYVRLMLRCVSYTTRSDANVDERLLVASA